MKHRLELLDFALNQVREAVYLIDRQGTIQYVNDEACRALGYPREDLMQLTVADFDPDWPRERWYASWHGASEHLSVTLETRHLRQDGSMFPVEITASPFNYRGVDYKLAMVRDISERRRAEGLLSQRERAFRTLVENVPDIVMRYDENCRCVYVNPAYEKEIGSLAEADLAGWGGLRKQDCIAVLREVIERGTAAQLYVAWPATGQQAVEYQLKVVAEHDVDGAVCGALAIGRNITLLKNAERHLETSHVQLRELAAHADIAREEERKHIARELHDELGQVLSALRMQISVLRMQLGPSHPVVSEKAESMLCLVDKVIWVVRDLVSSLRPAVLDMGIESALEWLGDEFTRNTSIACRVSVDEAALELEAEQTIIVFRIVQESLTNVTRHAHAGKVEIALMRNRDMYVLKIRDNGRGFDPHQQKPDSYGLLGLRERAQMLNGHLEIHSDAQTGTSIIVRFPLEGGTRPRPDADPLTQAQGFPTPRDCVGKA